MPVPPPTAYPAGTKLTVGSHEVEIVDFIGEGGFAHVYTVRATPPIPGQEITCLKRVQVPDKAYLNLLRAEVDAMQRLKGASNIVQYFDSHAERMNASQINAGPPGQYEVFMLMEYCERGGLIDFMNTRLRDQLREHEILKIMYDITLGLAHMHYLLPPLLHRDLKIENVLITGDGEFKLCDFGSVSPVLRPAKTPQELKILEDDIQHHTTVQYRAPEMIDVSRGHPIDEKSDIWALGIFLYKLCYYTTPFERPNQTLEQFQQLILSGSFTIPARPAYSDRLRNMIRVLLQPNPRMRPNVFQVMQEICSMRRVETPITDIYRNLGPAPVPGNVPGVAPPPSIALPVQGMVNQPGLAQMVPPPYRTTQGLPVPPQPPAIAQGQPAAQQQQLQLQQQQNQQQNQQKFVPGVPHYRPQPGNLPAPGQVPVPGVLLTSPMPTPASPERSVSPLSEISLRYPSLEELDRLPQAGTSVPSQATSVPSQATSTPGSAASSAPKSSIVPANPKPSLASPSLINFDDTKVEPENRGRQTNRSNVGSHNVNRSPSSSPERDSSDEPEPPVSAEAMRLKQILNGISDRSSTVIMDSKPQNSNLSSVDFLRTLRASEDQGGYLHLSHHRKPPVPLFHSSKPGSKEYNKRDSKYAEYEYDDDEDDDDDDDYDDASAAVRPTSTYGKVLDDGGFDFEDSGDLEDSHGLDEESLDTDREDNFEGKLNNADPPIPEAGVAGSRPVAVGVKPAKPARPLKPVMNLETKSGVPPGLSSPRPAKPAKPLSPKPVKSDGLAHSKSLPEIAKTDKPTVNGEGGMATVGAAPVVNNMTVPVPSATPVPISSSVIGGSSPLPPKPVVKPINMAGKSGKPMVPKKFTRAATSPSGRQSIDLASDSLAGLERTKPRLKHPSFGQTVTTATAGELDTFKPSNTIQQRVHMFLNSHDRQHPPRRTARGYGRFTDVTDHPSNDSSDNENGAGHPVEKFSIIDAGDQYGPIPGESEETNAGSRRASRDYHRRRSLNDIPPLPSRAAKPQIN